MAMLLRRARTSDDWKVIGNSVLGMYLIGKYILQPKSRQSKVRLRVRLRPFGDGHVPVIAESAPRCRRRPPGAVRARIPRLSTRLILTQNFHLPFLRLWTPPFAGAGTESERGSGGWWANPVAPRTRRRRRTKRR
jgi:hypothetical protein